MTETYTLMFELLNDAAFASEQLAGDVDTEIAHNEFGLPVINGRTIKGLLVNECGNLLAGLSNHLDEKKMERWKSAANKLFGLAGSMDNEDQLSIGEATVAPDLAAWIESDVEDGHLSPGAVLASLTAIRRQTAIDPKTGAPKEKSLRKTRVLNAGLCFFAPLNISSNEDQKALLASCIMALRRGGLSRNRGLGKVKGEIWEKSLDPIEFVVDRRNENLAPKWLRHIKSEVKR